MQSDDFKIKREIQRDFHAATRETETSYILITRQQPVEMPMLSVQSLCKTIRLL